MKKAFSISGMVIGAVVILIGLLVLCGVFEPSLSYGGGNSYLYDSGYATFGSDYYTYSNNNMAEAASYAHATAQNTRSVVSILQTIAGLLLMSLGLFGVCGFGIVFANCKEEEAWALVEDECCVEETAAEEAQEEAVEEAEPQEEVVEEAEPQA